MTLTDIFARWEEQERTRAQAFRTLGRDELARHHQARADAFGEASRMAATATSMEETR